VTVFVIGGLSAPRFRWVTFCRGRRLVHEASWCGPIIDPTACKVTRRSSRNVPTPNPIECRREAAIPKKGTLLGTLTIKPSCKDEMRVGQKNKLTYRWARTGSRPRAVHDQRTQSTYLFGAVCPERGTGSGLVLPVCNAEAMQLHLDDIATKVAPRAHAILIFDQAGWHGAKALKTPPNLSLMPLPPRSPELNPQENVWQFVRANWLSNRVFKSHDDIVDHCCFAWNTLIEQPWKIMSIARRDWATIGQSL
jgi:hypothetical protein